MDEDKQGEIFYHFQHVLIIAQLVRGHHWNLNRATTTKVVIFDSNGKSLDLYVTMTVSYSYDAAGKSSNLCQYTIITAHH